jgi:hypothetical protein
MNSIMERWIQSCRHELLDRTLVWNQRHLLHALHEYERHHNTHRPHRGISNARPLHPLPEPITDPDTITRLYIHRRDRLGGVLHEYEHAACADKVFGTRNVVMPVGRPTCMTTIDQLADLPDELRASAVVVRNGVDLENVINA